MSSGIQSSTLRSDGVPADEMHRVLLLDIVAEAGEITADELHDRYDDLAHQWYYGRLTTPVSRRLRSEVLGRLASEGYIEVEGENSGRVYYLKDGARVEDHLSVHLEGSQLKQVMSDE